MDELMVATDFSDRALAAVTLAVCWAKRWGVGVHVLHVFEECVDPILGPLFEDDVIQDALEALRHERLQRLHEMIRAQDGEGSSRVSLVQGNVVHELVQHALEDRSRYLVMGTTGLSKFESLMMGSTANRLLRQCPIPVLFVPAGVVTCQEPKTIMAPVDMSACSALSLQEAQRISGEVEGAHVHVLYVASLPPRPNDPFIGPLATPLEDRKAAMEEKVHRFVEESCGPDHGMSISVLFGEDHEVIIQEIDAQRVDLVCMGTHGRRGLQRLLVGSTSERVTRSSRVPVLVVPSVL